MTARLAWLDLARRNEAIATWCMEEKMQENVGRTDQIIRTVAGSALVTLGYGKWGGDQGQLGGLGAIVSGALILESAVTRTCPLNALFGIDSREPEMVEKDVQKAMIAAEDLEVATAESARRVGVGE